MFVLFAALAAIAFYGLWKAMPETATLQGEAFSAANLWRDYRRAGQPPLPVRRAGDRFRQPAAAGWIAQSPVILISGESLSTLDYGLLQIPVFGALILGNLTLARLTGKTAWSA